MTEGLLDPPAGLPVTIAPGVQRLLAPNPSPMTHSGTNTYLLGDAGVAVIDPGPDDARHLAAILAAMGTRRRVSHIIVTHAHRDHSGLAPALRAATGAHIWAFGDASAGRSAAMARLAAALPLDGGEGVDRGFAPDFTLADGARLTGEGWEVTAHWTPGHMGNHLALQWRDAVFTGDLVMGWASTMISPPDGDLAEFRRSLGRLKALQARLFLPGHGAPVCDPAGRIDALRAHRAAREAQILAALAAGPGTIPELTAGIYADVDPSLHAAAARNVLAHLIDLRARGAVSMTGDDPIGGRYALASPA